MATNERTEPFEVDEETLNQGKGFGRPTVAPEIVSHEELESAEIVATEPAKVVSELTKPVRTAPSDVDIPTEGMPKAKYWFNCKVRRRPDIVPEVTEGQRQKLDSERREKRILLKQRYIWDLSRIVPQMTVSLSTAKGSAGKTTYAALLAEIVALLTKKQTVILPATDNTLTGTVAEIFGVDIDEETGLVTLSTVWGELEHMKGFPELEALFSRTDSQRESGLWVIYQDRDGEKADPNRNYRRKLAEIVEVLMGGTSYRFLDHGNDDPVPNSLPVNAVQMSDVVVFTASTVNKVTYKKMRNTMGSYVNRQLGLDNAFLDFDGISTFERLSRIRDAENRVATEDKVRRSIALFGGLQPDQDLAWFEQFCSFRSRDETAQLDRINCDGHMFGIPWDPYIAESKPTDIDKLERATYEALLDVTAAIFEQTALQNGVDLPAARPHDALGWEPRRFAA